MRRSFHITFSSPCPAAVGDALKALGAVLATADDGILTATFYDAVFRILDTTCPQARGVPGAIELAFFADADEWIQVTDALLAHKVPGFRSTGDHDGTYYILTVTIDGCILRLMDEHPVDIEAFGQKMTAAANA